MLKCLQPADPHACRRSPRPRCRAGGSTSGSATPAANWGSWATRSASSCCRAAPTPPPSLPRCVCALCTLADVRRSTCWLQKQPVSQLHTRTHLLTAGVRDRRQSYLIKSPYTVVPPVCSTTEQMVTASTLCRAAAGVQSGRGGAAGAHRQQPADAGGPASAGRRSGGGH